MSIELPHEGSQYRAIDKILYPSLETAHKLSAVAFAGIASSAVASAAQAPELGAGLLSTTVPYLFGEWRRQHTNIVSINENVTCTRTKQSKDVETATGTTINKGDFVGELHFRVDRQTKQEWRGLPPFERARKVVATGLDALVELSTQCEEDSDVLRDIAGFHATSHILRPTTLSRANLSVQPTESPFMRRATVASQKLLQMSVYGLREGLQTTMGPTHELWATRDELVAARPQLEETLERFTA